jgi:hypothetical protein
LGDQRDAVAGDAAAADPEPGDAMAGGAIGAGAVLGRMVAAEAIGADVVLGDAANSIRAAWCSDPNKLSSACSWRSRVASAATRS